MSSDDVADIVDALCALAIPHPIYILWRPYVRDAGDEHVLELAVAARCDRIVTHNLRDFAGAETFGITVVRPGAFLRQIEPLP